MYIPWQNPASGEKNHRPCKFGVEEEEEDGF
jgi:hypothetical protein